MTEVRRAATFLSDGRMHEMAGRVGAAAECYTAAAERAAQDDDPRILSEALRRRGVLYHLQGDGARADHCCSRAFDIALLAGARPLAAEAMNALAGFAMERGRLADARRLYGLALDFADQLPSLTGKIEQNLGVEANIRGDWNAAAEHYQRALYAYEQTQDLRGCAIAYHNLGRLHADQGEWRAAAERYVAARHLARAAGDLHHHGMALLGLAEVGWAERRYAEAELGASQALAIFCRIDADRDRAGAHRLLGLLARDQSQYDMAEFHFIIAAEVARRCECPLEQADACRDMAENFQRQQRMGPALEMLRQAHALYRVVDPNRDLDDLEGEIQRLGTLVA